MKAFDTRGNVLSGLKRVLLLPTNHHQSHAEGLATTSESSQQNNVEIRGFSAKLLDTMDALDQLITVREKHINFFKNVNNKCLNPHFIFFSVIKESKKV